MENLGFEKSAKCLEEESNIKIARTIDSEFSQKFYEKKWDEVIEIVERIDIYEDSKKNIKFFLLKMKYIESLFNEDFDSALKILREELTQVFKESSEMDTNQTEIDNLSQLMLCADKQELIAQCGYDINKEEDIKKMMILLQNKFKSKDSFAPNRLVELLNQSIYYQAINCDFHNHENLTDKNASNANLSLFQDHKCQIPELPSKCFQTLRDHTDEVWQVKFSNDSKRLVSYASNCTVIMWKWNPDLCRFTLNWKSNNSHRKEINCISWSHDDKK